MTRGGCAELRAFIAETCSVVCAYSMTEIGAVLALSRAGVICVDMSFEDAPSLLCSLKSSEDIDVPVIAVSDDEYEQEHAVLLGADDFIPASPRRSSLNRLLNMLDGINIFREISGKAVYEAPGSEADGNLEAGGASATFGKIPSADIRSSHLLSCISGGDALMRISKNIDFTYISEGAIALTGYSKRELIIKYSKPGLDIICGDDIERVRGQILAAAECLRSVEISFRIAAKGGNLTWIKLSARFTRREGGCLLYHTILTGVSEETRLYTRIIDELETGIYITNRDTYEILYINREVYRQLGIVRRGYPHVPGEKCFRLLMGRDTPCPFCRAFTLNADSFTERTIRYMSTERYFRLRGKMLDWCGMSAHIEYITEVTDEKLLTGQLEDTRRRAGCLETLGRAAASCGKPLFGDILTALCGLTGASSGFILIRDQPNGAVRVIAHTGEAPVSAAVSGSSLLSDESDADGSFFTSDTASLRRSERALYNLCGDAPSLALRSRFSGEESSGSFRVFIGLCGIAEENAGDSAIGSALSAVCAIERSGIRLVQLELQRKRLSMIASSLPGAISIYDPAKYPRGLIYLSDYWKKLTGYPADEQIILANTHPEREKVFGKLGIQAIFDGIKRAFRKKSLFKLELAAKNISGARIWLEISAAPIEYDGKTYYCGYISDVTERRRAYEEFAAVNGAMNALFEHYDISYWEYDLTEDKVKNSYRLMRDFNLPREMEDYSKSYRETDCICDESAEAYAAMLAELRGGCDFVTRNIRLRYPNGRLAWSRIKYSLLRGSDGTPLRAFGTAVDITRQLAVRSRYDELKSRLGERWGGRISELCYNVTHDRILEYSGDIRSSKSVNSVAPLHGRSIDAALPYFSSVIEDINDLNRFLEVFSSESLNRLYAEGKTAAELVYRRTMSDGRRRFVRARAELAVHPSADDIVAFIVIDDINAGVIAEQVIGAITAFEYDYIMYIDVLRGSYTFINNCPDTVFTPDTTGLYDEVVKNCAGEVSVFDDSDIRSQLPLLSELQTILTEKKSHTIFASVDYGRGTRRKRLSYSYIGSSRDVIMLLRSDITEVYSEEKRKNDILLGELAVSRQHANDAGELLSRIIGELRHSLSSITQAANSISGFISEVISADPPEHVRRALSGRPYAESHASHIQREAGRLMLTADAFSKVNDLHTGKAPISGKAYDFRALMLSVFESFSRRAACSGIVFTSSSDCAGTMIVSGDAERLSIAVSCLLENALKFTDAGHNIDFYYSCRPEGGLTALKIKVSDTGRGISEDFLEHIYEPLSKEDITTDGAGLGLYICRELITALGGTVVCESRRGIGSVFTITLTSPTAGNI